MDELFEYIADNNTSLSENAIKGLGLILQSFPTYSQKIMKRLLVFLKIGGKRLIHSILGVLKDLIAHLDQVPQELTSMFQMMIFEPLNKKIAVGILQIIQQKPKSFPNSPYLAEQILLQIQSQKIPHDSEVLNAFLDSIIRVFLERPGETLPILSSFYKYVFGEGPADLDVDLQERCFFYYNLMKTDPKKLRDVICTSKINLSMPSGEKDFLRHIESFGMNDLRILFQKSANEFIKPISFFQEQQKIPKKAEEESDEEDEEGDEEDSSGEESERRSRLNQPQEDVDLLEMSDEKVLFQQNPENLDFVEGQAFFEPNVEMESQTFQENWMDFWTIIQVSYSLKSTIKQSSHYETLLNKINIYSIAQSEDEDRVKFYLFARRRGEFVLMELNLDFLEMEVQLTVKKKEESGKEEIESEMERWMLKEGIRN